MSVQSGVSQRIQLIAVANRWPQPIDARFTRLPEISTVLNGSERRQPRPGISWWPARASIEQAVLEDTPMTEGLTRRAFIGGVAMTGAVSALGLDLSLEGKDGVETPPVQRKISFDDGWGFSRGDLTGAESANFAGGTWTAVDLPHDWSITGPFNENEPSSKEGAYLPTGIGWYRKSFHLPRGTAGRRVAVLFDGVYQRSNVWINGQSLGMRPYGFIGFSYDLTPYLHYGKEPNFIAVRVDNSLQPNLRWYSGSGIYRHAWLVFTNPLHIAQWGTVIRTPAITPQSATVEISSTVRNETGASAPCSLTTTILDSAGKTIQTGTVAADLPAGGEHVFQQQIAVPQPALWSPDTPHLYAVRQTLEHAQVEVDGVTTSFGIREVHFDADRGFLLNGERVKLNGVCLHGDAGCVGTAVPERMWERRLTVLKEMGCNAIRCSHNPPAPEFLDLCDTMGFLVMDEAFDEWREPKAQTPQYGYHKYFDEWATRDLTDMLARDRNHPSIVLWSAGNEVPDQIVPRGPETLRALLDILRSMDPTRPVTVACDRIAAEPKAALPEFLGMLDVVGYNYVDRWRDRREKYYSIDRHDYPQRCMVGTETSSMRGIRGDYPTGANGVAFGQPASNTRIEVEQLQKFIQTYNYVSGDFLWAGIDYLGEAAWPARSSTAGALDTCCFPKDSYYFYQSLWTDKPVLHLFPHWNWKGKEGEMITVTCYTNCDTVELFLNGKSLGVKGFCFPRTGMEGDYGHYSPRAKELQTTADLHLAWDVPYQAGTIKAVGMKQGQVLKSAQVSTTGEPAAIRLTGDKTHINTLLADVSHVTVEVIDQGGHVVPTADHEITFAISGPGRILGIDNGNPVSHEGFQGTQQRVFNGLALAVLQSTGHAGAILLSASAPSLSSAEITVTTGS
jgi:beta-galactosidase